MIFLKINLPNFVQFKQYQGINWDYALGLAYFVQSKIFQFSLLNINSLNTDSLRMVAQRTSETQTAFRNRNDKFWNRNGILKTKRTSETETRFWTRNALLKWTRIDWPVNSYGTSMGASQIGDKPRWQVNSVTVNSVTYVKSVTDVSQFGDSHLLTF